MMPANRILLASHNTRGARAAERFALKHAARGAMIDHLLVVPDFWKGMMGDDWLNNASTRKIYGDYVESELEKEIQRHVARLSRECERKALRYRLTVVLGKPTQAVLEQDSQNRYELVVIGAPRPRGEPGLRSRIYADKLAAGLRAPLVIAPRPA
jgi:hypothetical protein